MISSHLWVLSALSNRVSGNYRIRYVFGSYLFWTHTVELSKTHKCATNKQQKDGAKNTQIRRGGWKPPPGAVFAGFFMSNVPKTRGQMTCKRAVRAFFRLLKFPRKAKDHPAAPRTTPISCAALICINVSKGCRSILAGAFIGCAAVKQHWRIRRANGRKGREKTNTIWALCSPFLP